MAIILSQSRYVKGSQHPRNNKQNQGDDFLFTLTLCCWNWNIPNTLDQHHGVWCPDSACHQVIKHYGIGFAR